MSPLYSRPSNGSSPVSLNGNNHTNLSPLPFPLGLPQETRIRKVLQLVQSEPAHTIHELALQFKLSPSHLQHLFKQHTGVQLGHFMLESRLLKAASLLENSNMSVKEIAVAVGYEHTSSFTRAFERRFHVPPRSYRHAGDRTKC